MKQFVIDANKVILSVSNPDTRVDEAEFEENEVYAIDIVASTGEGKVMKESQSAQPALILYIMMFSSKCFMLICSLNCWMRSRQLYTRGLWTRAIT